ncbi:hypothetical protein Q4595_05595 [Wenyingzhuangia sp. 1_MG-2023]|nr:hypothetical protein [Wenyingzhuangia sp. 1_MG-2023]
MTILNDGFVDVVSTFYKLNSLFVITSRLRSMTLFFNDGFIDVVSTFYKLNSLFVIASLLCLMTLF